MLIGCLGDRIMIFKLPNLCFGKIKPPLFIDQNCGLQKQSYQIGKPKIFLKNEECRLLGCGAV
jgi:hypothetical protein